MSSITGCQAFFRTGDQEWDIVMVIQAQKLILLSQSRSSEILLPDILIVMFLLCSMS
jgi:hypothetical protein